MKPVNRNELRLLVFVICLISFGTRQLSAEEPQSDSLRSRFPVPVKVDTEAGQTDGLPNRVQNPSSGMWYALVPAGTYTIGSDQVWDSKKIQVQLSPYYISETCVTRSQLGPELWKSLQQGDWLKTEEYAQTQQFPDELQAKFRLLDFMMTFEGEQGLWGGMLDLNPELTRAFDDDFQEFLNMPLNSENVEEEKEPTLEEMIQAIRLTARQKQTITRVKEAVATQLNHPQRGPAPYDRASFDNAVTYAEWKGVDLPTEAQWEVAAQLAAADKLKVDQMVGKHWEYCSDYYAYDYFQRDDDFKDPAGPRKAKWSREQLEQEKKAEPASSFGLFNWLSRVSVKILVLRGGCISGREYYPSKTRSSADSEKPHRIRLVINPRQKS
ncbi:SUMF1/EgtB/PvdO family nonheme iron enzyme [Gimesia sp.]|uniref:SUMF1/EgtB/PvdO family nonheme iron enzyme n=1 Tax=Gimesia sp. TaxID=2024833 RepID=UPI003A9354FC